MYVKIKANNGSIVIYYGVRGEMRFPTGVTISKAKNSNGKFTDFDYKKGEIRNSVENYQTLNKTIKSWEQRANSVIDDFLAKGLERPTAEELKKALRSWQQGQSYTYNTKFLDAYSTFYQLKYDELVNSSKRSPESFKTYNTFRNTIIDYEAENGVVLTLNDTLNKRWLKEFDTWLMKERPENLLINGVVHRFKTEGEASERTRDKRFEVLRGFVTYLTDEKVITNDDFLTALKRYRKDNITITEKIKTTLTIGEIHQLYNIKFSNDTQNKVVRLFLFACLTGFRWKDIEGFNREFIIKQDGKLVYEYIANKTKHSVASISKVPLCKLAINILEELGYKLNFVRNATANEALKIALKESGLFNKLTFVTDKSGKKKARWEIISMHRGRDTFITNLIGTVPLHELMVYTSHEKMSTLQGYIDKKRPINPDYVDIFDI